MPLLFIALLTIYFLEQKEFNKRNILYPAFVLLLLGLIPLLGNQTYAYFQLPAGLLVGYAAVLVYEKAQVSTRIMLFTFLLGIFLLFTEGGQSFAGNQQWDMADNGMKIPAEAVEVFDILLADNPNPKIIAPKNLSPYARVYNTDIVTLYSYPDEEMKNAPGTGQMVYEELLKHNPDTQYITEVARDEMCGYVILDGSYHYPEMPMENFDFELMDTVGSYNIYKDAR